MKAWPRVPCRCPPGGHSLLFCPTMVTCRTCGSGAHSGCSGTGPNGLRGCGLSALPKMAAHLGDLDGPLLRPTQPSILHAVGKRTQYQNCMKVINKRGQSKRSTRERTDRLEGGGRPCWRGLYMWFLGPPVEDPTWAVALNALIFRMNSAVLDQCPAVGHA